MCHIRYAPTWDVDEHDGANCVHTFEALLFWECWMFPDALAEASNLIGVGGVPGVFIFGVTA